MELDFDYLDWWAKYYESMNFEDRKRQNASDIEDEIEEVPEPEIALTRNKVRRDRRNSFVALKEKS